MVRIEEISMGRMSSGDEEEGPQVPPAVSSMNPAESMQGSFASLVDLSSSRPMECSVSPQRHSGCPRAVPPPLRRETLPGAMEEPEEPSSDLPSGTHSSRSSFPQPPFREGTQSSLSSAVDEQEELLINLSRDLHINLPDSPRPSSKPPRPVQARPVVVPQARMQHIASRGHSQSHQRKHRRWAKTAPYLDKKKAQQESKAKKDIELAKLRREPATGLKPSDFAFFWPEDSPPIQEVLGEHLEELDSLRLKFGVHMYRRTEIVVSGADEASIPQIEAELQKIWKGTTFRSDIRIRAYLVEPPPGPLGKHTIALVDPRRSSRPYIRNEKPRSLDWGGVNWRDLSTQHQRMQQYNYARLLDSTKECISKMPFFSGLVRMRVHFGTFILNRLRKDPRGSSELDLDEFCAQLQHERAEGRVVPGFNLDQNELLRRFMAAHNLLEPMGHTSSLYALLDSDPVLSASFEFADRTVRSLRLEVFFQMIPGSREVEKKGFMWLKSRGGDDFSRRLPLQLGMIDFAKSDWQLDVEFFLQPQANAIKEQMEEFVQSIHFRPCNNRYPIFDKPVRKVLFSEAIQVSSVVEKAALQFRIKSTPYVLELARYDHFSGVSEPEANRTSWGATLFNPAWDEMLGSATESSTGENITPEHFTAFFPPSQAGNVLQTGNQGFDEFLTIVQRVSELLRPSSTSEKISHTMPSMEGLLEAELGTLF
ncbi:hypothetical protein N7492_010379 [Penicillium capsulatum]|uniref:DUF7905 domain-containing protein n=1 Tax=Penicillium capsulatum TaxID=69766 RepID=A0A9W9HR80_9EURO|nr:hypothetical protein N7492_010379 [Penicillium capsulatum]KAJ6112883.1 hypothetical protein N7512_008207 [Penicillium capsulatum]